MDLSVHMLMCTPCPKNHKVFFAQYLEPKLHQFSKVWTVSSRLFQFFTSLASINNNHQFSTLVSKFTFISDHQFSVDKAIVLLDIWQVLVYWIINLQWRCLLDVLVIGDIYPFLTDVLTCCTLRTILLYRVSPKL